MKKLIVLVASRLFPGRSPMKITRRFAVATLLVVAVAVVLGAPAPASAGRWTGPNNMVQVKLYPPTDGPFPNASGQLSVSIDSSGASGWLRGVAVSKLAPNTSYNMWPYGISFRTDAHGAYKSGNVLGPMVNVLYALQVHDSSSGTVVLTSKP